MSNQKQPLDYEEPENYVDPRSPRLRNLAFYLELIPLILIASGVYLRSINNNLSGILILSGGLIAGIMYLFFSWYLFKVEEYVFVEVLLSVLAGLIFAGLVFGVLFKIQSWEGAGQLIYFSMTGGLALCGVSFVLYLFQLGDPRSSRFYRKLLSRLLIFVAIAFSFSI